MRRVVVPELLDSDAGTPAEVEAALADLRWFNRWFGGTSTLRSLLELVLERTRSRRLSLLDVAAGPAEASRMAAEQLRREGIHLEVTVLDRAATHLHSNGTRALVGDALALPLRDNSFDLVTSSLFLHHLEPEEIVGSIDEALRVARVAVLINDLRRHPLHLALALAGVPLYRSRLTRHDAPASVRRAYTSEELSAIIGRHFRCDFSVCHHFLYRQGLVIWKPSPAKPPLSFYEGPPA